MSLSDDRSFAGFEGFLCEMSAVIHGQDIALGITDVVGIYPGGRISEAGLHDLDHAVASGIVAELQGGIAIVKLDPLDLVAVAPEDFLDVALGVFDQVADFDPRLWPMPVVAVVGPVQSYWVSWHSIRPLHLTRFSLQRNPTLPIGSS